MSADKMRETSSIQIWKYELEILKLGFFAKKPTNKSNCKETNKKKWLQKKNQWIIFI